MVILKYRELINIKEETFHVGFGFDHLYDKDNQTIEDRIWNTVIEGIFKMFDEEIDEHSDGVLYHGDSMKFEVRLTYEPENK